MSAKASERLLRETAARIGEKVNFDESAVPAYTLPDALVLNDGAPIESAGVWSSRRREEILSLFRRHVYGDSPAAAGNVQAVLREADDRALGGAALRRQWSVVLDPEGQTAALELLLYLPARPSNAESRVPVFVGLNFHGNHAIHLDPAIHLPDRWVPNHPGGSGDGHRATDAGRGQSASRWPVEQILERGYGLATAYCGDLEPDHPGGARDGVRAAFSVDTDWSWGAIAAWAWGLGRALDVLGGEASVDSERIIAVGHSRLGKTALWAAAQDERFAAAISNDSGCMGAALSRRRFGETVDFITGLFPHWFTARLRAYAEREHELPLDQHMLLALLAPRPLYVASAAEDAWADPRGEFLAAREASRVYEFLGVEGLAANELPEVGQPVMSRVGYHIRPGKHDLTAYDWEQFLEFADRHVRP